MHIGEVATRTELSLRSLRHWEDVGLVVPSARTEGGFRLYTEADVERILFVRRMKPLGFTLDEMKAVMNDLAALRDPDVADADRDAARGHLAEVQRDAAERRARLERQVAMADEFVGLLADELGRRD
jgi:MerR family copper efflux transcriptional regulator